jgi:DNA-binding transcriptional MerR regulator
VSQTASNKLYYRIGEVADILKVNTSVLRFWETQFEQLSPQKSRTGQRMYSQRDLELATKIHQLLYKDKLTIAGAKARISPSRKPTNDEATTLKTLLISIRQELYNMRRTLE